MSIITNSFQFSGKQVISLELSTGIPLLYIYKDRKYMKRGSPVGPTEAGVYAYTDVRILCSNLTGLLSFHISPFA